MNYFLDSYHLPKLPDSETLPNCLIHFPTIPQPVLVSLKAELDSIKEYQNQILSINVKLEKIKQIRTRQLSRCCESQGGHFWAIKEDKSTGKIYCRRCNLTKELLEEATLVRLENLFHFNFTSAPTCMQTPGTPRSN